MLLFIVVQAIFLLIDASLESGVPKIVVNSWTMNYELIDSLYI